MVKSAAIFFDRHGVLIKAPLNKFRKPISIKHKHEIEILDHVERVCKYFKEKYYLIMITNQPDVSRKNNSKENIEEINLELKSKLELDDIYVCYSDNDDCPNRKPNPGMIFKAQKKYNLNLKNSYFIGDRWRDVDAGIRAGCISIFLNYNYNEALNNKPNYNIKNLNEVLNIIR